MAEGLSYFDIDFRFSRRPGIRMVTKNLLWLRGNKIKWGNYVFQFYYKSLNHKILCMPTQQSMFEYYYLSNEWMDFNW